MSTAATVPLDDPIARDAAMTPPSPGSRADTTRPAIVVFGVALLCLTLELVASRIAAFYLAYSNSFLAIPLALFGLALGSLRVHVGKRSVDDYCVPRDFRRLVVVSAAAVVVVFLVFSRLFQLSRLDVGAIATAKLLIFCGAFAVPFYLCGRILSVVFARYAGRVSGLYSVDFLGAAAGCFLAPILLQWLDLPLVLAAVLALCGLLACAGDRRGSALGAISLMLVCGAAAYALTLLERCYDFRAVVAMPWSDPAARDARVEQVAHRWNAFSRVAVLEIAPPKRTAYYRIVHDNAESNVSVVPYRPRTEKAKPAPGSVLAAPFLLGRPVADALVMFAGCGRQMVELDQLAAGRMNITGVELNPLVVSFARTEPRLLPLRLDEFFSLPHIRMTVEEGRSFLDRERRRFDYILVASDAATFQYKTSHSRKYLDTVEAMQRYLDRLSDSGLLVFQGQPVSHKAQALRELFARRGRTDLSECVAVLSAHWDYLDSLILSPRPFSVEERRTLQRVFRGRDALLYAPGMVKSDPRVQRLISGPPPEASSLVTDDRPYVDRLDFAAFELLPSLEQLRQPPYYKNWIRIATLAVVGVVTAFLICLVLASRSGGARPAPPGRMFVYLLVSGFLYMLCQIVLIGRLELFLGDPLLSMALLLSVFLLGNGLGSALAGRLPIRVAQLVLPAAAAALVPASLWLVEHFTTDYLSAPKAAKVAFSALAVMPLTVIMGGFYPTVVRGLSVGPFADAIPVTYGISTLSSVLGATYAMTMLINCGYSGIATQACIGYAALILLAALPWRLGSAVST